MRLCNVIRKFYVGAKYLAAVGLCFGALGGAQVSAQAVPASKAFDAFMWTATGGSAQTVGFSSTGQPVLAPGVPTISTDGGLPKVTATGSISNPSGVRVPVTATGRVSGLAASAALGKALLKVAGPLTVGMALYDMAKDLGYVLDNSSGGPLTVQKQDSNGSCTLTTGQNADYQAWLSSKNGTGAYGVAHTVEPYSRAGSGNTCTVGATTGAMQWDGLFRRVDENFGTFAGPLVFQLLPSTVQELTDEIANKSGWPSTSNISRALVEATTLTGEKLQPQTVTVTGPATSTGTTQTTTSPTEQTTKSTVHNHTYNGDTITTTTVQTTNITNISTGATTTETQTTQDVKPEEVPDMCKANPDIVGCQKTDVPTTEVPKTTKTITWAEENLGLGNGACPAPYTFNTSNGNYSLDLAQYCDVLSTYVRPVVLAMALLAAFFIVAPVRTDV